MEAVWVALIVAVLGPILLSWLQNRARRQEKLDDAVQRRAEKLEDYARQDKVAAEARAVAAQAAEAARLLARRQDESAARVDEVAIQAEEAARLLLESNAEANGKLDTIHILVNSNMTAAMQAELDATQRELTMMREVIRLNKLAGTEATTDAAAALKATELKIAELRANLADRLKATEEANAYPEPDSPAKAQADTKPIR
jgi:hypothetical protein